MGKKDRTATQDSVLYVSGRPKRGGIHEPGSRTESFPRTPTACEWKGIFKCALRVGPMGGKDPEVYLHTTGMHLEGR